MISFDYLILESFIEENRDFLQDARVQKIQQPTRSELVFTIRNKGESRKFYININPRFFHVCFMSEENEKKRLLQIPKQPPMFCMLLRKYIESAKISKIEQPKCERILEFYFETYNEIGEKIYLCLAIELMGKHSNVILYNYDTNMIIGCAHNVGAEKSSVREVIGGLPYAYPPKKNNKIISGLFSVYSRTPRPSGERESFRHEERASENMGEGESFHKILVNSFIDNYFAPLQEEEKIKTLRTKLKSGVNAKLKKHTNSLSKLKKQSITEEKAERYRKTGDLLMANLHNLQDFSPCVEILDWETNLPVMIELDETKTVKDNANRFYKLYNKAKTANLKMLEMQEGLNSEIEYFKQILYTIEVANTYQDLIEIEEEVSAEGKEKRKNGKGEHKKSNQPSKPLTLQTSIFQPFTVFIGKNNKQNDYIVSKLARSEDIWFHTHNCAGSHVLLRVEAGQKVTDEIIFECAKLAKEYSSAKLSSKVGVIYTKAKNLKKPPAAALGYVIYKNEQEIIVD
jgi:predicted ribosome quality control (RQC) complex YloA/Tae2 family protein